MGVLNRLLVGTHYSVLVLAMMDKLAPAYAEGIFNPRARASNAHMTFEFSSDHPTSELAAPPPTISLMRHHEYAVLEVVNAVRLAKLKESMRLQP